MQKRRNSALKNYTRQIQCYYYSGNKYLSKMHQCKKNNYINKAFIYLYCFKYRVYNNFHNLIYKKYLLRPRYFRVKKKINMLKQY